MPAASPAKKLGRSVSRSARIERRENRLKEHERYIEVSPHVRIFATETGSGPTVLLCDGLGCDGYIWQRLRPALARNYQVVHWNYRGHGRSDPPRDWSELSVQEMLRDLLAVMDSFGVKCCSLLGHSMGVQVILQAAVDFPERFSAVIPICGSYGRPLDTFYGTDLMLQVFPWVLEASERFGRLGQRLWSGLNDLPMAWEFARRREMNPRRVGLETIRPYFEHMAKMDVRVFLQTLAYLRDHSVESRLDEVSSPCLVIAGAHDTFTPVWLSRRMARMIPRAELLVVEDGTHVAPLEAPEQVESKIEEFIARNLMSRRSA